MSLPDIDLGSLFDVSGKVALVGATGSFGQVVCAIGASGSQACYHCWWRRRANGTYEN